MADKQYGIVIPGQKKAVLLAKVSKISLIARIRPVFLADGPGYLLYLHDLNENIN